jgi:hypothetical protein
MTQYANVATSTPSTHWFVRSPMKFRRTRGEYWLEASDSVTIVIEKATPATVTTDVAIAVSTPRAPSAPTPKTVPAIRSGKSKCMSRAIRPTASSMPPTTSRLGTNQRLVAILCQKFRRPVT